MFASDQRAGDRHDEEDEGYDRYEERIFHAGDFEEVLFIPLVSDNLGGRREVINLQSNN